MDQVPQIPEIVREYGNTYIVLVPRRFHERHAARNKCAMTACEIVRIQKECDPPPRLVPDGGGLRVASGLCKQ